MFVIFLVLLVLVFFLFSFFLVFRFEVPLPFYLRSPSCDSVGPLNPCSSSSPDCSSGAFCSLPVDEGQSDDGTLAGVCSNENVGGGCGGLGLPKVLVGTFLALYIIIYGQVQTWTPQLITTPLKQTPPNKLTEIMYGLLNCIPTLVMGVAMTSAPAFLESDQEGMLGWMVVWVVVFAVIFAINSSIHSFLVVK